VICFVIGYGLQAAKEIYWAVKRLRPNIEHLYSDANSCYGVAFKEIGVTEPYSVTKSQTHLIESSNSSIRDNLARFNRKTKRYSKTYEMLYLSLLLFIHKTYLLQSIPC
jgi:IS1 family transposase